MKIFMSDCRKARMCAKGTRAFFITHRFDFQDFLKNGIDEDKLIATGDAMAKQVVEVAHGRK